MQEWVARLLIVTIEGPEMMEMVMVEAEIMEIETVEVEMREVEMRVVEMMEVEIMEVDLTEDAAVIQEAASGHRPVVAVDLHPWIRNKDVKWQQWEAGLLMVEEEEVMAMVMATDVEVRGMVVPLTLLTHVQVPAAVVTEEASLLWILNKGAKLPLKVAGLPMAEVATATVQEMEMEGAVIPEDPPGVNEEH